MSYFSNDAPLVPRNGHTLVVGIVARISGCQNQKELSLEDQADNGKEVTAELHKGPKEFRVIATKGKGERLDRPELEQIEAELRTDELDLLVIEDLGRLIRGADAVRVLGVAVDHKTRVISPADCIDTIEPNWEQDALEACAEHVGHNIRTSKRIKQKVMNRFLKYGFTAKRNIHGYIVPEGAKAFADWLKDDSATAIIKEGADRLLAGLNCSAVADWFQAHNVPVGPYCRRKSWNGAMVKRFYNNRLLSGRPSRGNMHTVKIHATGRRVSVKNPKGANFLDYPHLAHLEPHFQDELIASLAVRNAKYKRPLVNGRDRRCGVSTKQTRCPGQHACCWYCGRQSLWGGNGISGNLMCKGARDWQCWNAIGFNGELAAKRLVEIITKELYGLEAFDAQYVEMIQAASGDSTHGLAAKWDELHRNEAALQRERENVRAAVLGVGMHALLQEQLNALDTRAVELAGKRWCLERDGSRKLVIPQSTRELRCMLEEEFEKRAINSPEFGDLIRQLVPEFHVYLVRLCDGGKLLPRARVRLDLAGSVADADRVPELKERLTCVLTIDLFEPLQREAIREQAVRLAAEGLTHKQIAARLPDKPTSTAVGNALALDRMMRSLGLTSPYVTVLETPDDYTKLRRHKNSKYRFEPLHGYQRPEL